MAARVDKSFTANPLIPIYSSMNAKKLFGYALGPLGSAAASALSLPLISWYFSADDIGRIVLLQAVSSLTLLMLGLGLDQAYIREYYSAPNKAQLFKTIVVPPFILSLVGMLAVSWYPEWLSIQILALDDATLGLWCLLFFGSILLPRYLSLILRMQERAFAFSLSQFAPKILILFFVLLYIALQAPKTTFYLIAAYTVAQWCCAVILIWQTRHELIAAAKADRNSSQLKETLRYGIPLAAAGLAYWGLSSIDRFALKKLAGLSELGVYSMAVSFGAIALIFQSIFSTIWAPMVFKWIEGDQENLKKIGTIVDSMLSLIVVILCVIGLLSPLVPMILPANYAPVQFILLSSILFPLLYTLTEVTGIGINVSKQTWLITVISLIALICNLALLYWLIPRLGARGAAVSTATSFWLFFVMKTECSIRLWQPLPRNKLYGTTLICLLSCIAYTCWGNPTNYFIFAAFWLFVISSLYIQNKHQLHTLTLMIKGRLKGN